MTAADQGNDETAVATSSSPAADALVLSIRGRIIEYKELLLRQLVDQRVALLAMEDAAVEKSRRMKEEEEERVRRVAEVLQAEQPNEEEDEDMEEEQEDDGAEEEEMGDQEKGLQRGGKVAEDKVKEDKEEGGDRRAFEQVMNGHRKRRASETDGGAENVEVVTAAAAPHRGDGVSTRHEEAVTAPAVPAVRVIKRIRSATPTVEQPLPPPRERGSGRLVQRTSTPPPRRKSHLDGHGGTEEIEDDNTSKLVLLSPPRPLVSSSSRRRSSSVSRHHNKGTASVDDLHAEFASKLNTTLRLEQEVSRRRGAMARKRQLPRLPVPPRAVCHWDLLLDEMKRMAMDFSAERNWKRVAQWHLASEVVVTQNAERVRRETEDRERAKGMARHVAGFWRTMERIAARSSVRLEGGGPEDEGREERVEGGTRRGEDKVTNRVDTQAEKKAVEEEEENKNENQEEENQAAVGTTTVVKFKTIELASAQDIEDIEDVKRRLQQIVSTSRKARQLLRPSAVVNELHERAIQRVLSSHASTSSSSFDSSSSSFVPTSSVVMLAAFQLVAIRWMLALVVSGCNVLLNDQLGMGKASTVAAFLRVLQVLQEEQQGEERAPPLQVSHPHLVIVPADELHKWCYFLHEWNSGSGLIQMYGGSAPQRLRQQRQWTKKLNVPSFFSTDEVLELEKEDRTPLFACVVTPEDLLADQTAFFSCPQWASVIVEKPSHTTEDDKMTVVDKEQKENKHPDLLDDVAFVELLTSQLRHSGQRVLCCSQPLTAWRSTKLRSAYCAFLLVLHDKSKVGVWTKKALMDKSSAVKLIGGSPASSSSSLLVADGATTSTMTTPHVSAMALALACLSLRRVRREVESQLGKLDEQSVACRLTTAQETQYRNAVTAFASSSSSSSSMEDWLSFFLHLRRICNCVDVLNDVEKLALADLKFLFQSSSKIQKVYDLVLKLVISDHRRVVIYCQLDPLFQVLEMLLALMEIPFVQILDSSGLCHFALKRQVQVALVSTRLASASGTLHAMPVYGGDAIIVVDSDWQATWDAKLRASWAKTLVSASASDVPVYRLHCDATIEAALLRGGSCLSEKLWSEMAPSEVVGEAGIAGTSGNTTGTGPVLHRPIWWSSSGGTSSSTTTSTATSLSHQMAQAEARDAYHGTSSAMAPQLQVACVELSADEHLLLANADELLPIEWFAVRFVHASAWEKKRASDAEQEDDQLAAEEHDGGETAVARGGGARERHLQGTTTPTLEQVAVQASRRVWQQELDPQKELFYYPAEEPPHPLEDPLHDPCALARVLRPLGMDVALSDVVAGPRHGGDAEPLAPRAPWRASEDTAGDSSTSSLFRVVYREPPAPIVAPPPSHAGSGHGTSTSLTFKLHADGTTTLAADGSGKPSKSKKNRKDGVATATATATGAGATSATGVKRKHSHHDGATGGTANKIHKVPRLDFDGLPLDLMHDGSSAAGSGGGGGGGGVDDDFWGDTNLDALDSASWDDSAVLSGILGPSMDVSPLKGSSATGGAAGSGGTSATGSTTTTTKKKSKASGGASGTGSGSGVARRKSSVSDASGGTSVGGGASGTANGGGGAMWHVQDDLILKKLFELYGSNWTLIAHVVNRATSVSRFVYRKRTPRQCYDRYGKLLSSSSSTSSSSGATPTKESAAGSTTKSTKHAKLVATAVAALWTPLVVAERIGLPPSEVILAFDARDSLPGVPPPLIHHKMPTLVELSVKKKKKNSKKSSTTETSGSTTSTTTAATSTAATSTVALDDLQPMRTSFDAIVQCMKKKTPPTPIPIPPTTSGGGGGGAAGGGETTKAAAAVAPIAPHKSHGELVAPLPRMPLAPDEVIKRSKEAAAVAIHAASSCVSSGSLAMAAMGAGGGASGGATVPSAGTGGAGLPRPLSHNLSPMGSENGMHTASSRKPSSASVPSMRSTAAASQWGDPSSSSSHMVASARPPHGASSTTAAAMALVGGIAGSGGGPAGSSRNASPRGATSSSSPSQRPASSSSASLSSAIPGTTTSALLHVLDRMPEIKHKIQAILNRNDCSEPQKVAMIARLLSNTNALNASAVAAAASASATASPLIGGGGGAGGATALAVASPLAHPLGAPLPLAMGVALTSSSLETPLPMPAALAAEVGAPAMAASSGAIAGIHATTSSASSAMALASALDDPEMAPEDPFVP